MGLLLWFLINLFRFQIPKKPQSIFIKWWDNLYQALFSIESSHLTNKGEEMMLFKSG